MPEPPTRGTPATDRLAAEMADAMATPRGCNIIHQFLAGANLGTRVRIKFEERRRKWEQEERLAQAQGGASAQGLGPAGEKRAADLRKTRLNFMAAGLALFARTVVTEAGRASLQSKIADLEAEAGASAEPAIVLVLAELRKRLEAVPVADGARLSSPRRSQRLLALFREIQEGRSHLTKWQALQMERSWNVVRKRRLVKIAALRALITDRKMRAASRLELSDDEDDDPDKMEGYPWKKRPSSRSGWTIHRGLGTATVVGR